MRFTIRGVLAVTLLVAVGLHSARRRNRIRETQAEIESLELAILHQNFEADYVSGHTAACERALDDNPLPSPYFVDAKAKHDRLFAIQQGKSE